MFPLILSMHIPFNSFYAQPLLNALKEKKISAFGNISHFSQVAHPVHSNSTTWRIQDTERSYEDGNLKTHIPVCDCRRLLLCLVLNYC